MRTAPLGGCGRFVHGLTRRGMNETHAAGVDEEQSGRLRGEQPIFTEAEVLEDMDGVIKAVNALLNTPYKPEGQR